MATQPDQGIKRELSLGDVLSKTFELYRRDFAKYFVIFAIVGVITMVTTRLLQQSIVLPMLAPNPTPAQISGFFSAFFTAFLLILAVSLVVSLVFSPIAYGCAIKLASERIEKGEAELGRSVRFTISKLPGIWALSIIIGIVVLLGVFALVIPGLILGIMFSLAIPVLLIENKGVLESLGRSRVLVSNRWLKTFATFLVLGIIVGIAGLVVGAITGLFGFAGVVANGILYGFFGPLYSIMLTVYYYSNLARVNSSPQSPWGQMPTGGGTPMGQMPMSGMAPGQTPMSGATTTTQTGTTICRTCGTPVSYWVAYCPKCGTKINQDWTR